MEQTMMISNLIIIVILLIFNAFYILGLHKAAQGDYILSKPNEILNKLLLGRKSKVKIINLIRSNLYEALIGCIDCMASIHSIIFLQVISSYLEFQIVLSLKLFFLWIIYVCMLSFIVDFFDTVKTLIITFIVKNS